MSAHLKAKKNVSRKTTPRVNMFWEFPWVQEILHISLWTGCLFGERVKKIALSPNREPIHRLASYACVVVDTAYLVFRKFKHWSCWPKIIIIIFIISLPRSRFLWCHATWGMLRDLPTNEFEDGNNHQDDDDDDDDEHYKRLDDEIIISLF